MRDIENLMAYLPTTILKHLMHERLKYPDEQKFKTVCLFADVSGFTALSERLCKEGPDGIEELASQLNKYMGQIVKLTSRAGGDVLKFAGDAMFAIWPPEDGDITVSLLRAIQCSMDMQLRLKDYKFVFRNRDADGREVATERLTGQLNVKLGIGIGDVSIMHIGGESDNVMNERYDYVALGQALEDAFHAESCAKAGQVIISKSAYTMVKNSVTCDLVPDSGKEKCYMVKALKEEVRWKKKADEFTLVPSPEIEARVWRCVPAAVLPYLNESNEYWAPEVRRVTTLFCNLGYNEADLVDDRIDVDSISSVFKAVQQSVFQFEGTINKFLCDDKGSTLIAVFGLPPFAHENDATRGVLSAMSILAALHELGKEGSVGITTGEAFCGVVGTRGNRREYSVIGDAINTAARLMVEAKKRGCGHLMDRATYKTVKPDLSVEFVANVLLKGKQTEVDVYQVTGGVQAPSLQVARINAVPSPRHVHTPRKLPSGGSMTNMASSEKKKKKTGKMEKDKPLVPDDFGATSPAATTADMANTQREQIAAITEAPKLRLVRDEALKRRLEQLSSKDKATALVKGLDSFAAQSQRGLQMGSGRAHAEGTPGNGSPAPINLNSARLVKAAQITFNNCATPSGSKPELSTTFTLPLVEGINTFYDLKDAALTRLGSRQLLARGPQAKREFFTLRWNEPNGRDTEIADERERLDDQKDSAGSPIIRLLLVENQMPRVAPSKTSVVSDSAPSVSGASSSSVSNGNIVPTPANPDERDLVVTQLENVRNTLVWGDGSGKIVVFEGAQGVGKTRIAEDVFLRPDVVANVLTAVAMGNPYETERLSSPLSVWSVLVKQLLEEALTFKRIVAGNPAPAIDSKSITALDVHDDLREGDMKEITEIARSAMKRHDPKFNNFDALDALVISLLRTGHLPGVRASMNVEEDSAGPRSGHAGPLKSMIGMLAHLVVGLSLDVAPLIVLIDDAHFMDVASWHLTLRLAEAINDNKAQVLVVLLHRNLILAEMFSAGDSEASDVYDGVDRHNMRAIDNKHTRNRREIARLHNELLTRDQVINVEKKPNPARTANIICETLNVDSVPDVLLQHLIKKSGGNALFIQDALRVFQEDSLISVKGRSITLGEGFYEKAKYHELPIPPSVEGICATLLDTMSTTQQMALKVASIIGETFTLSLVQACFPITHLIAGLADEWSALVRLGIVVEFGVRGPAEIIYTFSNSWMLETLRKRMLGKQRRKLLEIYKLICQEREEISRANFMKTALNNVNFSVAEKGWLFVRKDHARNMLQPWKKRWVVLQNDELVQYYDETNPKKLEVIKLSATDTTVSNRVGGYVGLESNFGEKHFPYCFTIHATSWVKKGVEQLEPRDFFMAPDSLQEQSNWVFKLGYQIDFYKIQSKAAEKTVTDFDVYAKSLPKMWGTEAAGSHMSSIAGVKKLESTASLPGPSEAASVSSSAGAFLAKITGGTRKSILTPAPPSTTIMVRNRTRSQLPAAPSPFAGSSGKMQDVALGTEFRSPGASIVPMTAAHFKAISRDEALATFWASDSTTVDDVLVLRSSHHVSWFYEFGDMAFVSLNGQNAIDGYLLGFVSSRTPDHAVVHQCAVIPMVRRYGIGTKLYHKFFELAKKRGCHWVRSLVPRDSLGAIAFHRALGFDELGGEDWLATDMIVFIRELREEVPQRLT